MHDAIIAEGLSIVRSSVEVIEDVSFHVPSGSITGLIGPSGSGKTTLMRAIVGAQQITEGYLQVLGERAGSASLRPRIGYATQSPAVYDDLTAYQNLHYFARILGVGEQEVRRALGAVDMAPHKDQLVGAMSGGQRTRISLAVALLAEPPLLVLDEPTVGLDPVLRRALWKLFRRLAAEGHTLLMSSHVMDEAEQCRDILLSRDGQVLYSGTKDKLLISTHSKTVEEAFLDLAGDSEGAGRES